MEVKVRCRKVAVLSSRRKVNWLRVPRSLRAFVLLALLIGPFTGSGRPGSGDSGLRYESRQTTEPFSIHIVEVNPAKLTITAERALGKGIGRETVSSIAKRKRAIVAVNGGFFRIGGDYDGEPLGVLKIGADWFSEPGLPRAALGWAEGGGIVLIDRLTMKWSLSLGGEIFPVSGINRPRGIKDSILFTSNFNGSTLTSSTGTEVLVESGTVVKIRAGGNSSIPQNGLVFSVGRSVDTELGGIRRGDPARVFREFNAQEKHSDSWQSMEFLVGGAPMLLRGGEIVQDFGPEKIPENFVMQRHPRTAVGIRADGTWVIVVVDGRRPTLSVGMTLAELARLMKSLGCKDALNLDGGGSSTLYLYGQVVNIPSDLAGERPVSDAILIMPITDNR